MLKETPKSLRTYFGIIAVYYLYVGTVTLSRNSASNMLFLSKLSTEVFGVLFLYITIRFATLLRSRANFIKNVLTANVLLSVVFSVLFFSSLVSLINIVLGLLIYFYLTKTVDRLSKEFLASNPPPIVGETS